jgi:hypothetical protein
LPESRSAASSARSSAAQNSGVADADLIAAVPVELLNVPRAFARARECVNFTQRREIHAFYHFENAVYAVYQPKTSMASSLLKTLLKDVDSDGHQ